MHCITDKDIEYMRQCLALAKRAAENGDVPVGAVVVKNDKIIGAGLNRRTQTLSAVSHAETDAIDEACRNIGDWRLDGCTLYVTLEPCPMCAGAAAMARISRIVYGASEPSLGAVGTTFDMSRLVFDWSCEITGGILAGECSALLSSFFGEVRKKEKPHRLTRDFFLQDVTTVAESLLMKTLCVKNKATGEIMRAKIIETEAYLGEGDTASHASKGKTDRNKPMFDKGGTVYVYLCYGMHSMLNLVTGQKGKAEAVLIRGVEGANGPGRVTKFFGIDRKLNESDVVLSDEIWVEDDGHVCSEFDKKPRVGIEYAEEKDRNALLRYIAKNI